MDELGSEGNFWDEKDDGFSGEEGRAGKGKVDVGLSRAGDAVEKFGGAFFLVDF